MFRLHRAARALPRTASTTRAYSSLPPPPPSKPLLLAGVLAAGGLGYFSVSQLTAYQKSQPVPVPTLKQAASLDSIDTSTPVKALTLEEANEKLREQVYSFTFAGADGNKGRVDVVRLESNNRTEDEWDLQVAQGVNGASTLFAGVYDGHAGWATSAVLRKALISYVSSALSGVGSSSPEAVDAAIKTAFNTLDEKINNRALDAMKLGKDEALAKVVAELAPSIAGSCALLTMYDAASKTLRTAVSGDSRAVLGSWSAEKGTFDAHALSKDQTGFNEDEVKRLDKAHPGEKEIIDPKSGRLLGIAITRAFGDNRWKWTEEQLKEGQTSYYAYSPRKPYKSPPYMTAEPEVTTRQVGNEDFVIMASDGLWDVISNEDAVECVSRWVKAKKAGKPETVVDSKGGWKTGEDGSCEHVVNPDYFAIEDLDSAAVCLLKNALGGNRRELFKGMLTTYAPLSRYVRDDITIQVIFFSDPSK